MGSIHDKNQGPKISCYCTFKMRNLAISGTVLFLFFTRGLDLEKINQVIFSLNAKAVYTVKKAQWNFQLENHVTFHLIGIKIVYNVKIIYISTDIKLNSIEFTGFYITAQCNLNKFYTLYSRIVLQHVRH